MSSVTTCNQVHFRVRLDTGTIDATPTWAAAEDTNYSIAVETTFRLRFCVQNTGTANSTSPTVLRVSKNSGAYTAVTLSTGATLGAQSDSGASTSADEATLNTFRLTAGAGSSGLQGIYDENGSAGTLIPFGKYSEIEYGLILKTAGAAAGNTFDFRLYNNTTAFTTYAVTPRITIADTIDDLLANNVISTSSVSPAPQLRQEQAVLANDVKSNSSVSQPALVQRRDFLANDVTSASSVSQPAITIFAQTALLANDVLSTSSVGQPAAQQRQSLLANDVKSNSSVGQPAVKSLHGLLANDVISASSVGVPVAKQGHGVLANDVVSASSVSVPAVTEIVPEAGVDNLFANDVLSASSVTTPTVHQGQVLAAADVTSASSVTSPVIGEIEAGSLLADNVISASFVSTPTLVVEGEVIPVPPELGGGGGKIYGRGYSRKRYEELLRELEEERREALKRAETFKGTKGRKRAITAARAASEAIAAAREAADEAAVIAHAGSIARTLEAATQAKSLVTYVEQMKKAREEAIEMEDENDVEDVLLLVA